MAHVKSPGLIPRDKRNGLRPPAAKHPCIRRRPGRIWITRKISRRADCGFAHGKFVKSRKGQQFRCGRTACGEQALKVFVDKTCINVTSYKRFALHNFRKKGRVRAQPRNLNCFERTPHSPKRACPGFIPDNQLRNHRVVEHGNRVAFAHACVYPHPIRLARQPQAMKRTR